MRRTGDELPVTLPTLYRGVRLHIRDAVHCAPSSQVDDLVLSVSELIWHQVLLEFEPKAKLPSGITVPQDDGP